MKNLLYDLQRQVDSVKGQRIVAPFYPGSNIQVRVNGAVLELEPISANGEPIRNRDPFVGVWQVLDEEHVTPRGKATAHQMYAYFELLPQIRVIPVQLHENSPYTATAIQSRPGAINVDDVFTIRIHDSGNMYVHLLYEFIVAFDGHAFWVVSQAFGTAGEARAIMDSTEFLSRNHNPEYHHLSYAWPGLVKAYAVALAYKLEAEKSTDERLIESALKHAGSRLLEYNRLDGERFEVTFDVKGHSKTIVVDKNMNVLTAGICLIDQHGEHYKGHTMYDLQSFVGVMREYYSVRH